MTDKTKWISCNTNVETRYNEHGVYRIRLIENGQPVRIRRSQGIDEDGVLVIGRSENIERRLKQFTNASEGSQWWLVKKLSDFGKCRLLFDFIELESKKAIEIEKTEIQKYFKKHLETPPLNANIPQRRKWLNELKDKKRDRT